MLEKYDNGYLRGALNNAIVVVGPWHLKSETGEIFEVEEELWHRTTSHH